MTTWPKLLSKFLNQKLRWSILFKVWKNLNLKVSLKRVINEKHGLWLNSNRVNYIWNKLYLMCFFYLSQNHKFLNSNTDYQISSCYDDWFFVVTESVTKKLAFWLFDRNFCSRFYIFLIWTLFVRARFFFVDAPAIIKMSLEFQKTFHFM